jgi:hypothetical protein
MPKSKMSEKRIHPRIERRLPINLAVNGYDFVTSTENLSCLGAYCRINKYVPPFTRVAVKLSLPQFSKQAPLPVECSGVIVRSEDDNQTGKFNVAIFFNQINESQRKKIARYVNHFLPQS